MWCLTADRALPCQPGPVCRERASSDRQRRDGRSSTCWRRGQVAGLGCAACAIGRRLSLRRGPPGDQSPGYKPGSLLKQTGPAVEGGCGRVPTAWQRGAQAEMQSAICNLCGLGPGLTPAGDDWLAGWLLAQHLAPDLTGLPNLSGLVGRSPPIAPRPSARAFLACAAAGEADRVVAYAALRVGRGINGQFTNPPIYRRHPLPWRPPAQPCWPVSLQVW